MKADLREDILRFLEQDYGLKHRPGTKYMRGGTCPQCHHKDRLLYARHDEPWMIICGRPTNCGFSMPVQEIYKDLFSNWSKRAPSTDDNPNATARAYLEFGRGFQIERINGWFTQDSFYSDKLGAGTATVRFALDKGVYWERLIDRPERFGKMKARFKKGESPSGGWWCPPSVDLITTKELWIVEGIFDAIALEHNGIDVVSAMSSNNFPIDALKELSRQRGGKLPTLVWALDNEPQTQRYTKQWVSQARELGYSCRAALIPQAGRKVDWNNLHQRWQFEDDKQKRDLRRTNDLKVARHHGDLMLAESPREKAILIHEANEKSEFSFEFANRLYWAKVDKHKLDEEQKAIVKSEDHDDQLLNGKAAKRQALDSILSLRLLANCNFEALYKQVNESTGEAWYYVRIDPPNDGPSEKITFTLKQFSSSSEFKARLLYSSASWLGAQKHLDQIVMQQTEGIKSVETIDFVGYSKEHKAYIFNDIACHNGVLYKANAEDYFEFGRSRVKCLIKNVKITPNPDEKGYSNDWLQKLWLCFGAKGLVTLSFWFGSLFAEQIRAQYESFPFLEVTGEADAGKSTLLVFIWKLFGRTYEGFDPSKGSASGRSRSMGQVAGMPIVLLEGDRNNDKSFDLAELKDLFGGGLLGVRGVKNNTNETYEPEFRATIALSQNAPVTGEEPILSRIVKLHFTKPNITDESSAAADALVLTEMKDVSNFLVQAIKAEPQVMAKFVERYPHHREQLRAKRTLSSARVIKNHSMMLALLDGLALVLPLDAQMIEATQKELIKMAHERQSAISLDLPEVIEFWNVYEYLESLSSEPVVNHSKKSDVIAINLNEFAKVASEHRQKLADVGTLRQLLRDSRSRKLIDPNRTTDSAIRSIQRRHNQVNPPPESVKCWQFKA
ncbi:bifunctional DNA primase/helicase [Pseudomonas sp. PAMC 29040]|uniref:toprim domain-containing protein n=1 Tax=Pseudomonas sp. PAMC 29040 TaxID=2498450 RepID=UPI000FA44E23|nr:toprim domain-containing protein [Pseudomonas sp. PAMC 29040]RUT39765.1 bifunctional DNA primase/helicase [Pseudomonas sp. PAMC 29040]